MKTGSTKPQRNTTIADVARLAGVTSMTVSRLLNGSAKVSEATAEKIHRAIKVLRYQPNEVARSLRGLNSKTIGVIVPYLFDPFFATCAHAISTVAKDHGYSVILTTSDENAEIEQKQAILLLRRQVEGLVMIPVTGNDRLYAGEVFSRIPVVTLDRPVNGSHVDSVLVANCAGAKAGVQHLIGHGHRNIGFLGLNANLYAMRTRYMGYREALSEAGQSPGAYVDCISQEESVSVVRSMMKSHKPPTAFFAANNLSMRYLLHALNTLSVTISHNIAVVGFDDFDLADVYHPPITVIRQPAYQIGEVAANLLFNRISGKELPEAGHRVILPLELVLRRSCGCKPPMATPGTGSTVIVADDSKILSDEMFMSS